MASITDAMRAAFRPFESTDGGGMLTLSGTSASITATALRTYELILVADSGFATIKVGGTAVAPTTENFVNATFSIIPGVPRLLTLASGETMIHAIMAGGATAGTLLLNRMP